MAPHRVEAALLNGKEEIEAEFFDGSADEAFVKAVELNIAHGLPLTLTERKLAAARIMASCPDLSDRAIASIIKRPSVTGRERQRTTRPPGRAAGAVFPSGETEKGSVAAVHR